MLISRVEELRKYFPVSVNTQPLEYAPSIRVSQQKYLLPVLGAAFLAELTALAKKQQFNAEEEELMDYVRAPLANFAVLHFSAIHNVKVTDKGLRQTHSETEKPAFEHSVRELRATLTETGHHTLEELLVYLEKNRKKPLLTTWNTEVFSQFNKLIIPNSKVFNEYYSIKGSSSIYFVLAPVLRRLEDLKVLPILGEELLAQIKARVKNEIEQSDDYTPPEQPISKLALDNLRLALAHLSIHYGLSEMLIHLHKDGISLYPEHKERTGTKTQSVNLDQRLYGLQRDTFEQGEGFLQLFTKELQALADADKLDLFKESPAYTEPDTEENTNDSPGFLAI